ncbi:MGH1-like glycoside hydrolase domain-containing protein [Parafilimonas terrae]|uniref:Trehalase n=1 Tax=Parafilimonas terrae TaxID=1465490 RepID=A0A1I5TPB4_9BACT|nr:glycosyl hydrolase family 65 protein [Parafilimonas terrae]SFP84828.1 Trehalase [Parafilimonas terrae]
MLNRQTIWLLVVIVFCSCASTKNIAVAEQHNVLNTDDFKHYVDYFNNMEDENIKGAIPNDSSWQWVKANIPLFNCPQQNFEELFYYRWWTLRKHIIQTPAGYAFTEFLVPRSYADKYNLIGSAIGHHIYESRWLHNKQYSEDDLKVWYRGHDGKPMLKLHSYSSWNIDALYNLYKVSGDKNFILDMLPDMETDYARWESEKKLPSGLFWQSDVKDGMEETISGGRHEQNARPTINSYMYGNAMALSEMENIAGHNDKAGLYLSKADTIQGLIEKYLWNNTDNFFETAKKGLKSANVREEIGFIPWYFNMPSEQYNVAWKYLMDSSKFLAPFGITTAEQSDSAFRTHGCCKCEWDGAVWPYASSQTLTAMANLLNNTKQPYVNKHDYFRLMNVYAESQYYRGRPYIGEYLDEQTGYWLKGDQERSRYYNHSTFNDLIITGLIGLRPRADDTLEVNPLIPEDKWKWFCLDKVVYHGKTITVIWDADGTKYNRGKGLSVWEDGKKLMSAEHIQRLVGKI